ncbi:hypothetical protein TVAG_277100 [Trichomonas vaginalis G3]|uniref:Ubiquitin-like domain-containing protein n=1 Tax=Trichomonas vaginalis (strain ATCC PRA-98 / G3) TaxID=412133 RepID=A2FP70_TRIV3|nr:ubiquitin-like family [Trichomonas vaginalis G3]EAX93305.1 hypothetical protein TVAG_277100 [Trichomonas vaginalis G3]KAI5547483.1 ubiquitin-like family [Trichomonas vaginalis G3]|eukprot:XP_001306235.1 hypothetical protein [Trichomonas vaginalis G3]
MDENKNPDWSFGIDFKIQFSDGELVDMHFNSSDTVESILKYIQNLPNRLPKENQEIILVFAGKKLDLNEKIGNINLFEGATFNVFYKYKKCDTPNFVELRGFNRLARMGYSSSDIISFRNQFYKIHQKPETEEEQLDIEDDCLPALIVANGMHLHQEENLNNVDQENRNIAVTQFMPFLVYFYLIIVGILS